MTGEIPLFEIEWGPMEIKNAIDSITRGGYWANGPYIDEFESKLGDYLTVDNVVVFNSGTTALVSILKAFGIGPGDEVLIPSFTFIATANAVKLVGANPVFVDIEPERYGLNPAAIQDAITSETVAVVPVHYAGKPCLISQICDIAKENDLVVIEDAAEALGAIHEGEKVGTIGDAGMLSFCQNKVISTGEGGAIVTDNDDIAERLRMLRSHGRSSSGYFESPSGGEYQRLGSNYRMPDITASLGSAQMDKVESVISRRRRAAELLNDRLNKVDTVTTPGDPENGRHVYQLYTISIEPPLKRDEIIKELSGRGIASKVYFDPVHKTKYYRSLGEIPRQSLDTTEDVSNRVLSLPMSPNRTPDEADRIAKAVIDATKPPIQ